MIDPSVSFILASASLRRAELLTAAGFLFEIVPADVDETPLTGEPAKTYALRVARAKAEEVSRRLSADRIILAADTVVVAGQRLMGKPVDAKDAESMLNALSGACASGSYRCGRAESRRAGRRSRHDRGPIQPPERRRDCLVSLDWRVRGQGRWIRHPGPRRAIYRWDRRFLVKCRRTADRDGLPAVVPGRGLTPIDRIER